ncbi:sugar ABC transporter substrate-binding protein [Vibrio sp.]|nr:sugar ABC transporter substrate-binding protein [Vibrio viridaestus]MDC0610693.1 sugar ABC transporter substrate-binding protein [Vibrio sp.]
MKKNLFIKNALSVVVSASAILGASASVVTAQAADQKSVILLQPTEECTYCSDYLRFFKKEATAAGLKFETTTSPFDPANQANQVEQAIAKHPDAIILWPVDANALIPSMRKIKKAGIPLIISDAMPAKQSEKYWDIYTGGNSEEIGRESAKAMVDGFEAKGYGKKGEIFAITGTPGAPTSIGRMKGFKEELAKLAPDIKIVGEQPGNWDQNVAMTAASSLFTRFGDQVEGVYSVEDLMMAGVIVAAERAGIDANKLALVGVGCEVQGYKNIKAGIQYATVLSDAYSDAKYAVDAAVKLLNGEKQPKYTYLPNPIITKDNLNECKGIENL